MIQSETSRFYLSKYHLVQIKNATLAGGVAIGSCCNLMVHPGGALIIGTIAGCVCTCGMHVGSPFLTRVLKVHDVSSVHNLHGLPAILACLSRLEDGGRLEGGWRYNT